MCSRVLHFTFPPVTYKWFSFFIFTSAFNDVTFYFKHGYIVDVIMTLICIALMAKDVEQLFSFYLFSVNSFQWNVCPKGKKKEFVKVWELKIYIYILDTSPLSDMSFANIFLSVVGSPFIIFTWVSQSNF